MKHPITQSTRNILVYAMVWGVILILHCLTLFWLYNIDIVASVVDALIFNIIFAWLGIALWYPVLYNDIDKHSLGSLAINHLSIMSLTLVFWISLGVFSTKAIFSGNLVYTSFIENGIPWRVYTGIFFYMGTVLLYYLLIYENNLKDHILQEAHLKEKINEAELKTLKSQINPHFLFNSLNSIGSLTITNPQKAHQMIIKLSGFLRYSLAHDPTKLIPLKQELENIEAYISVEKERFGEKLLFSANIEDNCMDVNVPFLILQPLIENAIKHGVYESTEPVNITLTCHCNAGNSIIIHIENGFDPESVPQKGTGTGLKNIVERMKIIYQTSDLLTFKKHENFFEVTLVVPKQVAFKTTAKN